VVSANKPADLRARRLAEARQRNAHESISYIPAWTDLSTEEREQSIHEAAKWLRAAVEAGIAPAVERPTPERDAVWLDSYGQLWGEYQTSPSSHGDAILRLVWASEQCSSKQEIEAEGVEFRLIGWSE
jgi:hypothetical protein